MIVGVVVTSGRVGVSMARIALLPARVIAGGPRGGRRLDGLEAAGRRAVEATVGDVVASPAAARVLDRALAGPLPETVARSITEHGVVGRLARTGFADRELERAVSAVLSDERMERLLASPEFEQTLKRVLANPAVRAALIQQTTTFADEVAAAVRRRAVALDSTLEARARRGLRRRPPAQSAVDERPTASYGGLATRAIAAAVDVTLVTLAFLAGAGLVGLFASLVGTLRPQWLVAALAGSSWGLLQLVYFAGFWTAVGQTPGMRLMRLRVLDTGGAPPRLLRSLVRLAGAAVAIVPLFAGFLLVLADDRRRALPDFVARTVVVNTNVEQE